MPRSLIRVLHSQAHPLRCSALVVRQGVILSLRERGFHFRRNIQPNYQLLVGLNEYPTSTLFDPACNGLRTFSGNGLM
jgi:hypothetical protein